RGDPGDEALGALGEHPRPRMAEEEPPDHFTGARDYRGGEVAPHRQVPLRHAVVRRILAVARVLGDVVDPYQAFAGKGRSEHPVLRGMPNLANASRGAPQSV